MTHKIVKLAVIRTNDSDPCPFGLEIPVGCKHVGNLVDQMGPVELGQNLEEEAAIAQANEHLMLWKADHSKCKYAGVLLPDEKKAVECTWHTNTAGEDEHGALIGSPFYYRYFSGVGLDGAQSVPLSSYYTDTTLNRGYYYGLNSLEGAAQEEKPEITKESTTNKKIK